MSAPPAALKNANPVRIVLADDHDLIRRGLRSLLESHPGWSVCAEAHTGREAIEKAIEMRPDIAILDVSMPELNGIEAARNIHEALPDTQILVLSAHYSDQLIRDILDAGVRGYIIKSDSDRDLNIAVEALANHQPFFTAVATELLLSNFKPKDSTDEVAEQARDRLTSREREVLRVISEGKTNKEVASTLKITVNTAETHRTNILRKLNLHSTSELVRYAVRNRIVEP